MTLKRRLMFELLWQKDAFWLSRNFRVQKAGNLQWIEKNYNFGVIADAIDELIVVNISREDRRLEAFAQQIGELTRGVFVPLAAGGGIRTLAEAQLLLRSGADKLVVNTPFFDDPELVRELARTYGSQCVVVSVDYKRVNGRDEVFTANGTRGTGCDVDSAVARAVELGAGEVLLTSMDRDGTGQGYDLETLRRVAAKTPIPVIACGGVGNFDHLAAWLGDPLGHAACTANIFNFLGGGLREARTHVAQAGVPLATWEPQWRGHA